MEWVQFAFAALFILIGAIVIAIGVVGSLKYKYVLNRMHSAALLDSLGIFMICLGSAIANGFDSTSIKILFIAFVLWVTSPICSHLIAKLEFITDKNLKDEILNDLEGIKEDNDDDRI
ncbi:MAG: monovalent cation/H(+) antiporter subunit G [Erysipelotrichaceae bacterium]|nr:monovalent cation/H(+) antiporter subunit G [Erysipelotrichaceae bacterium]